MKSYVEECITLRFILLTLLLWAYLSVELCPPDSCRLNRRNIMVHFCGLAETVKYTEQPRG